MNKLSYVKKAIITAACIALCVVLPTAFHAIPNGGSIFSPMHIPVLLCGMICGWPMGLLCGIAGPILSSLITQMPPLAYLPSMLVELAVYGLVCGLAMKYIRTGNLYADIYLNLVIGMLTGRVIAGICRALIFSAGSYSMSMWISSYFITAWPAILLHLILVPAIVVALEKARLIPARYPKKGR